VSGAKERGKTEKTLNEKREMKILRKKINMSVKQPKKAELPSNLGKRRRGGEKSKAILFLPRGGENESV